MPQQQYKRCYMDSTQQMKQWYGSRIVWQRGRMGVGTVLRKGEQSWMCERVYMSHNKARNNSLGHMWEWQIRLGSNVGLCKLC